MDPLDALRDIHLPGAVGWWPPAIGWWVLALLILLSILLLLVFIRRRQQHLAPYRAALKEFDRIAEEYQQHQDSGKLSQHLSILLRRIAISIMPRKEVAGLTGELWLVYLDKLCGQTILCSDVGRQLLQAPYRLDMSLDGDELLATSRRWIAAVIRHQR